MVIVRIMKKTKYEAGVEHDRGWVGRRQGVAGSSVYFQGFL